MKKFMATAIALIMTITNTPTVFADNDYAEINMENIQILDFWEEAQKSSVFTDTVMNDEIILPNVSINRRLLTDSLDSEMTSRITPSLKEELSGLNDEEQIKVRIALDFTVTKEEFLDIWQDLFPEGIPLEDDVVGKAFVTSLTKEQVLSMEYMEELISITIASDVVFPVTEEPEPNGESIAAPFAASQDGLYYMGATKASEDFKVTGKTINIAVVDSGIDFNHPSVSKNLRGWYNFVDPGKDTYYSYHGTEVASVVTQYAPDVNIYNLTANNNQHKKPLLDAMLWLDENAEAFIIDAIVFSNDLYPDDYSGAARDEAIRYAKDINYYIDRLNDRGIPVFVAAGNRGPEPNSIQGNYFAKDTLYSVGGVKDPSVSGRYKGWGLGYGSNRGYGTGYNGPLFTAPSVQVRVAKSGGSYQYKDGTSYAAPAAAGTFALMYEAAINSQNTGAFSFKTRDMGLPGHDPYYGGGILNTYESVKNMARGNKSWNDGYSIGTVVSYVEEDSGALYQIESNGRTEVSLTVLPFGYDYSYGTMQLIYCTSPNPTTANLVYDIIEANQIDQVITLNDGINYIGVYNHTSSPSNLYFSLDVCGEF